MPTIKGKMKLDNTEPVNVFANVIHEFGPDSIEYAELKEGDIAAETERGLVLVERKKPDDLIASITDGRLFSQVTRMTAKTSLVIVAIDGDLNYQNGLYVSKTGLSNFSRFSVEGALFRTQLMGAYIYFGGDRPFGVILRNLLDLITTLPIRTKHEPITASPDPETQARIDYLSGLPGIGGVRAFGIVRRFTRNTPLFDVLAALVNSTVTGIFPDNIGEGTVNTVRDFLGVGHGETIVRVRRKISEWREFDSKPIKGKSR